MAMLFECSTCSFGFAGGHNHHTGYSLAICPKCLVEFTLRSRSEWGPEFGEDIPLCRLRSTRIKGNRRKVETPTGIFVTAEERRAAGEAKAPLRLVHCPIESVNCPECKSSKLINQFNEGEACPKCKKGTMIGHPILY